MWAPLYVYHLRLYRVWLTVVSRMVSIVIDGCHFFGFTHTNRTASNTLFDSSFRRIKYWYTHIKYRHWIFGAVELNCKQFQNVYIPHEFLMFLNPMIFLFLFQYLRLAHSLAHKCFGYVFVYCIIVRRILKAIIKIRRRRKKTQLKCHRNKIQYRIA